MIPLRLAATLGGMAAVLLCAKLYMSSVEQRGYERCKTESSAKVLERFKENSDELSRISARSRTDAETLRSSGRSLDAAADRLRGAVAGSGLVIRPAAAIGSAPASETELVSAELLRRTKELARFADESHRAGTACEESYEVGR